MGPEGWWPPGTSALPTKKCVPPLLTPQPHSHIPVSCEELPEVSKLLTRILSCNVSSPIFKADSVVSVSSSEGPGLRWGGKRARNG